MLASAAGALPALVILLTAGLGGFGGFLLAPHPAPAPAALAPHPPSSSIRAEIEVEVAKKLLCTECPVCPAPLVCESPYLPVAPWAAAGFGAGLLLGVSCGFFAGIGVTLFCCWLRPFARRHVVPSGAPRGQLGGIHPHLAIRADQVQW